MKRMLVFLLLGPILGVLAVLPYAVARIGFSDWLIIISGLVFLFGLVVSAVTGVIDTALVQIIPISLRAPCIAIVGATIAVGAILLEGGVVPQLALVVAAVTGALAMGACSLLSHDYNGRKARSGDLSGSLS